MIAPNSSVLAGVDQRLGRVGGGDVAARDLDIVALFLDAPDRIDHALDFDEFDPRAFGLVAVEGGGEHLGVGVAILDHAIPRLFQRIQPFAHVASSQSELSRE